MQELREILRDLGIPFVAGGSHHHVSRDWLGIDCPMCSPGSQKFRCGIHPRTRAVSCWVCGRMRLGDTLAAASGKHIREIMPHIANVAPETARVDDRPAGRYEPPPGVVPLGSAHKRYLRGRGLCPDTMADVWGMRGIDGTVAHRLGWRVFLPVMVAGKPVSWTTRAIGSGSGLRYLSAPPEHESVPIKSTLYGIDHVKHTAVVVEGPFDAVRIGPGAVATYGLTVTPAQIRRLSEIPRRVIVFDNEPAAQRRASQLCDALAIFPGETCICRLSDDSPDPGSATDADVAFLRREFLED